MPLFVHNEVLVDGPVDLRLFLDRHQHFKDTATSFSSCEPRVVGPVGLLYVHQREFAAVSPSDACITTVGTDDATTCNIAVLRHTGSSVVSVGHFDGSDVDQGATKMTQKVLDLSCCSPDDRARLELHLFGGFVDKQGYSKDLSLQLICAFHRQLPSIHLVTACLWTLNNMFRNNLNWPVVCGVGVNVWNGEIFPAVFPDKGVEMDLRSARHFAGCTEMLDIYDGRLGLLKIEPFGYEPNRSAHFWLLQNDDVIRKHLSTSPEVEPPHFEAQVRRALTFLQQNPYPRITVFPNDRPHCFRKEEDGGWVAVSL